MDQFLHILLTSAGTVCVTLITLILTEKLDPEKRWKAKHDPLDDIIIKVKDYVSATEEKCIYKAHLENSVYARFGWSMPVEAIIFLLKKENFPSNIEAFHKARLNMSFIDGGFHHTAGALVRKLAAPSERHIRIYERIGLVLTSGYGAFTAVLFVTNFGVGVTTIFLTSLWAVTFPIFCFTIYIMGATLSDMRRDYRLLSLNKCISLNTPQKATSLN